MLITAMTKVNTALVATSEDIMVNYGKLAYDAYCESSGGVSLVSGAKLPPWEELKPEIKTAWQAAADAIIGAVCDRI